MRDWGPPGAAARFSEDFGTARLEVSLEERDRFDTEC
jgi:hypothetical protein